MSQQSALYKYWHCRSAGVFCTRWEQVACTQSTEEGYTLLKGVAEQELKVRAIVERVTSREEGQDMVEYALLAALIAISAIAIIILVGPEIQKLFQDVINGLQH
jgi:pilus assembly protein Flp/PilA